MMRRRHKWGAADRRGRAPLARGVLALVAGLLIAAGGGAATIVETGVDAQGGGGAARPESEPWGSVGPWQILIDNTIGGGCFMLSGWDSGTFFRLGFSPGHATRYYLLIGNPAWASLTPGREYGLDLTFDAGTPWELTATATIMGGQTFLSGGFDEDGFVTEVRKSRRMLISHAGQPIDRLVLTQSDAAFRAMLQCQKAQPPGSSDPFAR